MHAAIALGAASLEPLPVVSRPVRGRAPVLSRRALNRALLARQLLLERSRLSVTAAVERLVGLQAQNPTSPYLALAARLADFRPGALGRRMEGRQVVRAVLMRSTIHVVTARDCLALRPLLQPVQERALRGASDYGRRLSGLDLRPVLATARAWLAAEPRTGSELAKLLSARWPAHDGEAMTHAARSLLPLVQVTPRGVWGQSGQARWTTLDDWLGRRRLEVARMASLSQEGSGRLAGLRRIVRRYLGAFGPASVADVQEWCGLTHLREVVEGLRPELRSFRDESGQELFDLPRAPRPDADLPAPVRFLPDFDNVLLSHAERSRIVAPEHRPRLMMQNALPGTLLVDGFVAGTWRLRREPRPELEITLLRPSSAAVRQSIAEESRHLPYEPGLPVRFRKSR